jgi:hypothetical protein
MIGGFGLDSSASGLEPLAAYCKYGKEFSRSKNRRISSQTEQVFTSPNIIFLRKVL